MQQQQQQQQQQQSQQLNRQPQNAVCRAESKVIRRLSHARAFRFSVAALRAHVFVLPVLWALEAGGLPLRSAVLYPCIVGFGIVRDVVVFRLLFFVTVTAEMRVSLARVEVSETRGTLEEESVLGPE
ncbi:hypothetical protein ACOMHN_021377 [Nucella lapillus]